MPPGGRAVRMLETVAIDQFSWNGNNHLYAISIPTGTVSNSQEHISGDSSRSRFGSA
jgi:hypothetical protein